MKEIKACCGFGHREVYENISEKLNEAVLQAIQQGCEVFYTGAMGQFDEMFSSVVRNFKKNCPQIRLICVRPYMTQEINKYGDYFYTLYDEIIIPTDLIGVHYKAAITTRNCWLIQNTDIVIVYIRRNFGGAHTAKQYADKFDKQVIYI